MKTIVKTVLIIVVLSLLADGVYRLCFWQHDRMEHSGPLMTLVDKIDSTGCDILYLGESSNHSWGLNDADTAWISEMIARHYPTLRVKDMTHDASHAEVFFHLLNNLDPHTQISTVVVTMNVRSFGVGWFYSPLETALQKRLVMMHNRPPLVNRAVLSFKAYNIKTEHERYKQMNHYWAKHPLPGHPSVPAWADSVNLDYASLAGTFVRNFAFYIDTLTNPRIHDFDRIVQLAQKRGWNLVFHIAPEDFEWAESLVGTDLTDMIRHNATLIEERYTRQGAMVANNIGCGAGSLLCDRDWTTEHFIQGGRQIIADNVSLALRKYYDAQYRP